MTIDNFAAFGARLAEAIACRDSKEVLPNGFIP